MRQYLPLIVKITSHFPFTFNIHHPLTSWNTDVYEKLETWNLPVDSDSGHMIVRDTSWGYDKENSTHVIPQRS